MIVKILLQISNLYKKEIFCSKITKSKKKMIKKDNIKNLANLKILSEEIIMAFNKN